MLENIRQTSNYLKSKIEEIPNTAIILGTGLGELVHEIDNKQIIPYTEIPNFPVSTVEGHSGNLIVGTLGGKKILAMQGRFHYYEGYSMQQVTFPIRIFQALGIQYLFVSNAAGGMNPTFDIGDIMLIEDHINLFPEHPLRGKNYDELGPRFPDMSEAYDKKLRLMAMEVAKEKNIKLQHGVYVGVQGPTFETPSEYYFFRIIGGDAVGMSTVPEVIVANHAKMKVLAFSIITDLGVIGKIVEVSHEDVQEAAKLAQPKIATLGEFGLIEHLTNDIQLTQKTSIKGVGDDAAVIDNTDKKTLVATDILLEGIHFDLTYVPLKHLGYKAAIVNFSDIYAMNGTPQQIVVSLGISNRFCVEDMDALYEGIKLACKMYGVDLVGGDTSSSLTGLTINIACIGYADENQIVYRNGAKNTDLIFVSGDLGAAYMGLQLLEREKLVFDGRPDFQPDFAGKEYLLERQLKPEARKDIVKLLAENRITPTAMIDISDGLASDMLHICKQSKVGCVIYEERIPIDYQTALMAETFNINVTTVAMNGGEDYELLFTVPLSLHEQISALPGIHLIGHITPEENGCNLITRDGQEMQLRAQGWDPLA
jgi:thiamine-monophosphate kinase